MTSHDDEPRLPDDEARFLRKLDALYRPPAATAAARARFAARLEERLARGRGRRPWLLGGAVAAAAAALTLALLPGGEPGERSTGAAGSALTADAPSTEEELLLLANGPLDDPDEALPEDYQTLASLLE